MKTIKTILIVIGIVDCILMVIACLFLLLALFGALNGGVSGVPVINIITIPTAIACVSIGLVGFICCCVLIALSPLVFIGLLFFLVSFSKVTGVTFPLVGGQNKNNPFAFFASLFGNAKLPIPNIPEGPDGFFALLFLGEEELMKLPALLRNFILCFKKSLCGCDCDGEKNIDPIKSFDAWFNWAKKQLQKAKEEGNATAKTYFEQMIAQGHETVDQLKDSTKVVVSATKEKEAKFKEAQQWLAENAH